MNYFIINIFFAFGCLLILPIAFQILVTPIVFFVLFIRYRWDKENRMSRIKNELFQSFAYVINVCTFNYNAIIDEEREAQKKREKLPIFMKIQEHYFSEKDVHITKVITCILGFSFWVTVCVIAGNLFKNV